MINVREVFSKEYPEKVIKKIAPFDKNTTLVIALDKGNNGEVGDPNYLVNNVNGSIRQFNPLEDLDKFTAALKQGRYDYG